MATAYLTVWGLFIALMAIAAFKANTALQVVFVSLAILFFIPAAGDLTGISQIKVVGGYEGLFCGSSAVYLTTAEILNENYGKTVLPIGRGNKEDRSVK